jgi:hypothetical protein
MFTSFCWYLFSNEKMKNTELAKMHVLYINLDSRIDRRKRMQDQCKRLGIVPHRISATTKEQASKLDIDMRSQNNLSLGQKSSVLDIDSLGAIACFQSHRQAWKYILDQNWEKAWILEDDAILRVSQDVQVDAEYPFVWLGQRGKPASYRVSNYPYPVLNFDRESYGSHGYCIHSSILPSLLEASIQINLTVDYFLNEFLYFHRIRVGLLDIAYTNEFLSFSDIDHIPIGKPQANWHRITIIVLLVLIMCFIGWFIQSV